MTKKKTRSVNPVGALAAASKSPAKNIFYSEVATEFINNGFMQTRAYATVSGQTIRTAKSQASVLFNKPFFAELIKKLLIGEQDAPPTKQWAIEIWRSMVESNVLDYMADDGGFLTVMELRELPVYVQRSIKKISVRNREKILKFNGLPVTDDDGNIRTTMEQHVSIELVDKQKALTDLAKAEKWIETHMNLNISAPVTADQLIAAQLERQRRLTVQDTTIEGESERVDG